MRNAEFFNVKPDGIYDLSLPIPELYIKYTFTFIRFSISPVFITFMTASVV